MQDILDKADKWGDTGRIDPFDGFRDVSCFPVFLFVYTGVESGCPVQLVFLMTARMTTCHDLTMNEADVEKIKKLLLIIQDGATPTSMLLSWFPGPARNMRKRANTELYTTLRDYVEARRRQELASDAIDVLIADGEKTQGIVWVGLGAEVGLGEVS